MEKKIKAVILAAGQGKRLGSGDAGIPKVMRMAADKPLLGHVLDKLSFIPADDTIIIVGFMKEQVIDAYPDYVFAEQAQQLGTGHAVAMAKDALADFDGAVLVCCGDMPLITRETYEALCEEYFASGAQCTILTGIYEEKKPYGRIVRDTDGSFLRIVEQKDCSPEEDAIREYNSGVYVFSCTDLLESLGKMKNNNAQNEYYLTDVPALILEKGGKVTLCRRELGDELLGVNTKEDLAQVEALLKK